MMTCKYQGSLQILLKAVIKYGPTFRQAPFTKKRFNLLCIDWWFRSSCPEVFFKKGVFKNFAKFTGKHLCLSFFFNKIDTLAQVFSCEFCRFFKQTSFYRTLMVLLLMIMMALIILITIIWKYTQRQKPF